MYICRLGISNEYLYIHVLQVIIFQSAFHSACFTSTECKNLTFLLALITFHLLKTPDQRYCEGFMLNYVKMYYTQYLSTVPSSVVGRC